MRSPLHSWLKSPAGQAAYRPFQRMLHFARRRAHPGVPPDHTIVDVNCREKQFSIEIRRWFESDLLAIEQCFHDEQYAIPEGPHSRYIETVYREIVAEGRKPLIVDCGANIGTSALWFHACYPEAHIVAVEPAPDNFELLRKNVRGVEFDLRQAGIGASDGVAWVSDGNGSGMGCRTNESGQGTKIQVLSMESVLASKPSAIYVPFLLKVDIEGAEKTLFAGAGEALDRFPVIVMEPHDWMFPGEQTSVEFFRFHAAAGREFVMMHENVVSIRYSPASAAQRLTA